MIYIKPEKKGKITSTSIITSAAAIVIGNNNNNMTSSINRSILSGKGRRGMFTIKVQNDINALLTWETRCLPCFYFKYHDHRWPSLL